MRAIAMLLVLLLAACGGGENTADTVSEDDKYIPDFSTAEGATEAFIRAVQTENLNLLSMCFLDDERDAVLRGWAEYFKASQKDGIKWKLEQMPESEWLPEKEARAAIKFTAIKDGKESNNVIGRWFVFVKTADGSWRYSEKARKLWMDHLAELAANQPAGNSPD